ncbi:MAG TPA: ribose-5-phosphate isomerase RpiA [Longimicrobium sp.]|nr:ribose-5-phosphate isomerase RpiA [Longimicrobium sp.]
MKTSGAEALKRAAAERAAEWIEDGMVVGLGTGSTVRHLLDVIAERRGGGEWSGIRGIPTSEETAARAERLGIPLLSLADHPSVDLTIDGADEVDPELNLIKGLGGALLREKVVASVSARLVIVADESKTVKRLGTLAPLPVEVDPFATPVLIPFLRGLGCEPAPRLRADGSTLVTDGGHHVLDCRFPSGIADAAALDAALLGRPGVMETGLFLGMASAVVIAGAGGVEVRERGR